MAHSSMRAAHSRTTRTEARTHCDALAITPHEFNVLLDDDALNQSRRFNLTTALITEQDLSRSGEPSTFDLLFKKFDQRGDDYINLDSLRLVCRELGETLGSGSEQSDEQLKDMLRFAKHDEGAAGGGPLQVTKQELWDCLSRTRLMK